MMKEVTKFHSLFIDRDNKLRGIGGKGMFLKYLKGDVKQDIWASTRHINTGTNMGHYNDGGIITGKISLARFGPSREESGQVRSILVGNLTATRASNVSNLQREKPSLGDHYNNHVEDDNTNASFVNQRLASRLRSSDSVQLGDTSNSSSSNVGGSSSHQVLMSYFGNETDLRKRLHSNNNEEDFIAMVNSGTASPSDVLKGIIVNSSRDESSSRVSETSPDKVSASEAAKKGNVTTLKDRVIIVVSPKSIRDLMRNRSGNSSQPFVHKGIPIMVGKEKNSTTKLNLT